MTESTPVLTDEELLYEEDIQRNPFIPKNWVRYLDHSVGTPFVRRAKLYERAISYLPASYKIWYSYLKELKNETKGKSPNDPIFDKVNRTFERALVHLSKMPRIWIDYCTFLMDQKKVTKARQSLDRALRSVAVTQHDRIWTLYLKFVSFPYVPIVTALRVHKRYMKWNPSHIEPFVDYLVKVGEWDEAAFHIVKLVNDPEFLSPTGKNKHQFWMQLCDIISQHSDEIKSVQVEPILRGGLRKFSDQVGKLWTTLADYYIRNGNNDKARDIFEEGMNTVITIRDFTQIWDAYATFEDTLISAEMSNENGGGEEEEDDGEMDMKIARYENLIERQALLINSVLLRQNPHNVHEWIKRAELSEANPKKVVEAFQEAIKTVDPHKAKGRPHSLWTKFARFYEEGGDLNSARKIFQRGVSSDFKYTEDLAVVWCNFVETELRNKEFEKAREILEKATTPPKDFKSPRKQGEKDAPQLRVYKNSKLWALYADFEEGMGNFLSTKAVYEKMIDLKAATPQYIINYANFLEENKYFEESFKAYEKGVGIFKFPHNFDIWITYLTKFVERYGGRKIERARELFEQAITEIPPSDVKVIYILYANLEEKYGLARRAMAVYDRATSVVPDADKFAMFSLYISRATEFFGVIKTRDIYEKAIEILPDKMSRRMCLRYIELEKKLGEVDRARALFTHCSQFCDPKVDSVFWEKWRLFEMDHGNRDTYVEMLRIRRSVQAQYSSSMSFIPSEVIAGNLSNPAATFVSGGNTMEQLERKTTEKIANAEEISLDDDDEGENSEEEKAHENLDFEQLSVPTSVIERNVRGEDNGAPEEKENFIEKKMGALERMKRKREEESKN